MRLFRGLLCAAVAQIGSGCGSQAAPPLEHVSVETRPDGFTTLLRGSRNDSPRDVTLDGAGHVIVVGGTESPDFPTTPGALQQSFASGGDQLGDHAAMDAFVAKLNPDGTLAWSTFLGGPNYDRAYAVEVDAAGNVYVGGRAGAGFPTTKDALQTGFAGDADANPGYGPQDGFVSKLSPDGSLLWSTYLGDPNMSFVRDIDIDAQGNVYAVLHGRGRFPYVTPGAFQPEPGVGDDNMLVKLDASGSRVHFATHLGRDGKEGEPSVRVDAQGRVFVLTSTSSDGWVPASQGFQAQRAGGEDLLLLRFSKDGQLEASSYLGGSSDDVTETNHLALDAQGRPVVCVATLSTDLPIPGTPWHASHGPGRYDGYVARLSADLDQLRFASYVGQAGKGGGCEGVAVDAQGAVFAGGATTAQLPTTPDALQAEFGGAVDAYIAQLAPDLSRALRLTLWGGPGPDFQRGMRAGGPGSVVSVGQADGDVYAILLRAR